MDEAFRIQANEWFQRANYDLQSAKILYEGGGNTYTIGYLIQQGLEKYLKGFLVSRGIKPRRTHDLSELLAEVSKFIESIEQYVDFCVKVTGYYVEDRYPPGPSEEYPKEEIGEALKKADELICKIEEKAK
ncbi:MAG: HEPN domain-containing protein [candidate division Zixibacteria bacterium]|nr:HEPN domain-containing protein [candidate division Zixibacteria bacterium]